MGQGWEEGEKKERGGASAAVEAKRRHERERGTHRVALGDERLPLGDEPHKLVLARLPHRLEHVLLLRRLVDDLGAKVLVDALVQGLDRLAQVLGARLGRDAPQRGARVGRVERDLGRRRRAQELLEPGEPILLTRAQRQDSGLPRGRKREREKGRTS